MGEIRVTQKELERAKILTSLGAGRCTTKEAAILLGLTIRHTRRLRRLFETHGIEGLVHNSRGKSSSRAIPQKTRVEIVRLLQTRYPDFGPTLASEKISIDLGRSVSRETIRKIQQEEGLWRAKKRKRVKYHPRRKRRLQIGELVQIDGSIHDWLEGRGPCMSLIAFVDDATSRVMLARFAFCESTREYSRLMVEYANKHGLPQALYSDKHSIFRQTREHIRDQGELTCFGQSLEKLGVELICANTPQAKGRVERLFCTFQDRVVKEMRLANVDNMEQANEFLQKYIDVYNERYAVVPADPTDAHVKLQNQLEEDDFIVERHNRQLSKNLSFHFDHRLYQVVNPPTVRRLQGKKLILQETISGDLKVKTMDGQELEVEEVTEYMRPRQRELDGKEVFATVLSGKTRKPSKHHPWR